MKFSCIQPIGIIHGDLNVSNLITEGGDLRYILGWQRPMLAPLALEQALALRLAGYESEDGRLMVDIVFKDMGSVPAYEFDVPVMLVSLTAFIAIYEILMYVALALRLAGYESEDGDWGKFATVCHILWHAWTYTHVLPIEGVRQMALKLADGFVSGIRLFAERMLQGDFRRIQAAVLSWFYTRNRISVRIAAAYGGHRI